MRSYSASEEIHALAANSGGGGKSRFSLQDGLHPVCVILAAALCRLVVALGFRRHFGEAVSVVVRKSGGENRCASPQNPKLRHRFANLQPFRGRAFYPVPRMSTSEHVGARHTPFALVFLCPAREKANQFSFQNSFPIPQTWKLRPVTLLLGIRRSAMATQPCGLETQTNHDAVQGRQSACTRLRGMYRP